MTESQRAAMPYVTLTTGGTIITRRSEVAPRIIDDIRRAVGLTGGEIAPLWSVAVSPGDDAASARYVMIHEGRALARCWLCVQPAASDTLWEDAQEAAPDQVVVARPRVVPWLATALNLEGLMAITPDVLMQLGDATRCVAWAIYDEVKALR